VNNSIHGHEIMRLIATADPPLTRSGLEAEVSQRFGVDVRFHACAGHDLTLTELLKFLSDRGKVAERDGQLHTDLGQICSDEG
jgi:probable metal-binding protein